MKTSILSVACILAILLTVGCQQREDQQTTVKPVRKANARRACGTTTYKFLYPDNGYGYNGNGCVTYFVTAGQTRQFKVTLNNYAGYSENKKLIVRHSNQSFIFQYSVASVQAGTISTVQSSPTTIDRVWTVPNMPAFTTYELLLNVTVPVGAGSGENTVYLLLDQPCSQNTNYDCQEDDNLHLVRSY